MDNVQRQNELRQDEIRVEVVQQQQQQQEQQSMQFDQLETYHQAEGESIEQARTSYMQQALSKQAEVNARLQQNFQRNVQQNRVTQTAPVPQPPVQECRTRESWKQRRERQNKVKKARKVCPVGNEYTLDISQSIKEYKRELNNSQSAGGVTEERARAVDADMRMLKVFCNGFKLKDGQPVSDEDRARMNADIRFLDDYLSGERERRRPHLERITQEIISMEFSREMLTPEYISRHAVQLVRMSDKLIYFESIMKENRWYFDSLPQLTKDLIAANAQIAGVFSGQLLNLLALQGINGNNGDIYGYDYTGPIESMRVNAEVMKPMYNELVDVFKGKLAEAYEREAERKLEGYKAKLEPGYQTVEEEMERQNDPLAKVKLKSKTPSIYAKEVILKVREMIEKDPEQYRQNKELIDKVYSEYYKCLDLISDLSGELLALQQGVDEHNVMQPNKYQAAVTKAFNRLQNRQKARYQLMLARAEALRSIMDHYLKGDEMTATAAEVLKEFVTQQST